MGVEFTPMMSVTAAMQCRSIPVYYFFVSIMRGESRFFARGEDDRLPVPLRHMYPTYAMISTASLPCRSHGYVFVR